MPTDHEARARELAGHAVLCNTVVWGEPGDRCNCGREERRKAIAQALAETEAAAWDAAVEAAAKRCDQEHDDLMFRARVLSRPAAQTLNEERALVATQLADAIRALRKAKP